MKQLFVQKNDERSQFGMSGTTTLSGLQIPDYQTFFKMRPFNLILTFEVCFKKNKPIAFNVSVTVFINFVWSIWF